MKICKTFISAALALLFLFLAQATQAQVIKAQANEAQEDWKLVKDQNGIQIETRLNDGRSFKEFRARTKIKISPAQFQRLLLDAEALEKWGHKIKSVEVRERKGDSLQVYYAVAKAPFPYKDRAGIYLNRFRWNAEGNTLTVEIELLQEEGEAAKDVVLMDGYGFWEIKAMDANFSEVLFQMQLDPGGNIPAWMANLFVSDSPFQTMTGLRDFVVKNRY